VRRLADLWAGRLPLGEAFWIWAVGVGLALNVAASAAMLGMLAAGLPGALALAVHLAPAPYNLAVVVAIWRSAAAYDGPPGNAAAARVAVVVWAAFLMLI
jgi:hypothetical protein